MAKLSNMSLSHKGKCVTHVIRTHKSSMKLNKTCAIQSEIKLVSAQLNTILAAHAAMSYATCLKTAGQIERKALKDLMKIVTTPK